MGKISEALEIAQKLVGLVGAVVPVLVLLFPQLKRLIEKRSEQARHSLAPGGVTPQPVVVEQPEPDPLDGRFSRRIKSRHALIELAFAALLAAAFSSIFADALLDDGIAPANPLIGFLKTFGLTLFIVALLGFAWLQKQLEFVTGTLAVTAMLVLLLSGHTSLLQADAEFDSGNTFLFTLLALLVVATGALTFLFGNPFAFGRERSRKTLWGGGVLLVVCLAAALVGRQKVRTLELDARAPSLYTPPVEAFMTLVNGLPLDARKVAYQLASELQLEETYRSSHEIVETKLRRDREVLRKLSAQQRAAGTPPSDTAPHGTTPEGSTPTDVPSGAPRVTTDRRVPAGTSTDTANTDERFDVAIPFGKQLEDVQLSELQHQLLTTVSNSFAGLSPSDRVSYLLARLTWVHPLGNEPGETRAALQLPATSVDDRFDATTELRIDHAFGVQDNLPPKKKEPLPYYGYPRPVPATAEPTVRGAFEYQKLDPQRRDDLFPPLAKDPALVDLRAQLTWPRNPEAWTAYEEYKSLASFGPDKDQNRLSVAYDRLEDNERASIRELIALEQREDRFAVLAALARGDAGSRLDFSSITKAENRYDITLIATKLVNPNSELQFADSRAKTFTDTLLKPNSPLNADQRKVMADMLRASSQSLVQPLFGTAALDWIAAVSQAIDQNQRKELFGLLAEPVRHAVARIAEQYPAHAVAGDAKGGTHATAPKLGDAITGFIRMKPAERESALLRMAKDLYGAGGKYALFPHEQLIYQARVTSLKLGILVAGLMTVPFFALAVVVGTFLARKLRSHYQHRALLERESQECARDAQGEHVLGAAIPIQGRESALKTLEDLGRRGWTTTAVVGRRGVGKSRALYELLRPASQTQSRISIWVSVPTEFDELEFVKTMLDRLAQGVENTVGRFLGAEPIAVRQAEAKLAAFATLAQVIGSALVWSLAYSAQRGAEPVSSVVNMVPTALLLLIGGFLTAIHLVRLQPVNLEPWLERDRAYQVATVLLYREARRVRALLGGLKTGGRRVSYVLGSLGQAIVAGFGAVGALMAFDLDGSNENVVAFSLGAAIVLLARLWHVGSEAGRGDQGFMMLVSCYRSFANSVVRRLGEGALGDGCDDARVVVAIDELDKMEVERIRTFVRRIKAVFEVPGVYYYVSISEDALARLYLGTSGGKDEFDSSFDHIIQLAPLGAKEAATAARNFLQSTKVAYDDPRLPDAVAVLSFGVPRDILRRADEARTWSVSSAIALVQKVRERHALLGYRSGFVSRAQIASLEGDPRLVDGIIDDVIQGAQPGQSGPPIDKLAARTRYWLTAWVLAAFQQVASEKRGDGDWQALSEELRDLGYRVAIDPPEDLCADVRALSARLFRSMQARAAS